MKIEKGIPMPTTREVISLPLGEMEVGDSIVIPANKAKTARATGSHYGKETNKKFTTRKMENGEFRMWRTE